MVDNVDNEVVWESRDGLLRMALAVLNVAGIVLVIPHGFLCSEVDCYKLVRHQQGRGRRLKY